jgi:transposase-like protein
VEVAIATLRSGSLFPGLLERRPRIDQARHAVIVEA